jgi:SAM-dependent methyltransferase
MDRWGAGSYEDTAAELEPMAEVAVAGLGLSGGERVLDVACGTGNAARVAMAAGARVTGIDTSERLVEVARERLPEGEFVLGDATEMPFADGEFDAAVSVVGVIFATPAERAAAEVARIVRPGGRVAITSWLPRGPTYDVIVLMREAVARVRALEDPAPDHWSDRAAVERTLGPYGTLTVTEHALPRPRRSPEERWERRERNHPMWIAARSVLEPADEWEALRASSIAAMRDGEGLEGEPSYMLTVLERAP